jgi:heme oxygenase
MSAAPLSGQLKTATGKLHAEMEGLPFFRALADGSLPLDSYLNQLRAFGVVFAALERSAAGSRDDQVREISALLEGRYARLLEDLEVFEDLLLPGVAPAVQQSLKLAHAMRLAGLENPRALLGHLYALGGTVLGNRVHLGDVRRILGGEGRGDAFYQGFGERTGKVWSALTARLDLLQLSEEQRLEVVQTAQETFGDLLAIHAALFPLPPSSERRLTATALNPEAGSHPVPEDPREIRAALAAGVRCRREFPYFEARYGIRGRRYTSSDVAWLATLPQLETAGVIQQVSWLADLLAGLGMPRILLERQLELLSEELSAQVPQRREHYQRLDAAAEVLRGARLSRLTEPDFAQLANQLESLLATGSCPVANLGVLILSSVADEACGLAESAAALETWLTESGAVTTGVAKAAFALARAGFTS